MHPRRYEHSKFTAEIQTIALISIDDIRHASLKVPFCAETIVAKYRFSSSDIREFFKLVVIAFEDYTSREQQT